MIREIREDDWHEIMRIQSESYFAILPESLATLQSKWKLSPETCFVYFEEEKVIAYFLSHPWEEDSAPDLNSELMTCPSSEGIFIHDLAVSKSLQRSGIGSKLFLSLLDYSAKNQIRFLSLVAIQHSVPFWNKFGFKTFPILKSLESYGEEALYMKLVLF